MGKLYLVSNSVRLGPSESRDNRPRVNPPVISSLSSALPSKTVPLDLFMPNFAALASMSFLASFWTLALLAWVMWR